ENNQLLTNVSILTDSGVRILQYHSIRSVTIQDDQSAQDLDYFLDTSMAEDDRRVVNVRLSEGEHDLAVYYVAPSPTWRVSYRLVADSDKDGKTGTALLQGWGLFDNRLEEDLDNVRVTLVAGQPISFIYELYASRIPQRPTVQDESRIAPGPISFDDMSPSQMMDQMESLARRQGASRSMTVNAAMPAPEEPIFAMSEHMSLAKLNAENASVATQAEGADSGETFQYKVTTPVSVKRGESALVPIIGETANYERELLYNGQKLPNHPVATLRFENNTGLTLERGPVTVVEDGDYKGEAVIPFTKDKQQVYVPYAVELGVKVTEKRRSNHELYGVSVRDKFLMEQTYRVQEMVYIIRNNTNTPKIVTVEATIQTSYELFDTPAPDAQTDNEQRWHVDVPAGESTTFVRKVRMSQQQRVNIRGMQYDNLYRYFKNNWLDERTFNEIRDILKAEERLTNLNQQIALNELERERIYQRQEQLRANLTALQPTGNEATLRNRILKDLENSQDKLDLIDAEIEQAKKTIEATEQSIESMLEALH
ncbi:MAG: hypothetical protein AAFR67_08455, partial [Chloroflexota bacterium]